MTAAPLAPRTRTHTGMRKSGPTPEQQRQAEALVTAAVAAYLLTDGEVKALSGMILTARLASLTAAYRAVARTIGASLPHDWQPSGDVTQAQQDAADANAASIADTYRHDAIATATAFLLDWLKQHAGDEQPLAGAREALTRRLNDWATQRAVWKAPQIAQHETSSGGHAGTQGAVNDALSGDLTDENGDPFSAENLRTLYYVVVLPEDSSSDFCFDYAGNIYAFDDAPSLDFPAHLGCIHYIVIVTAADIGDDEAPM